MAGSVKVGGAWKTVSGASVKVGGAWKTVSAGYTKVGGAWKQWYSGNQFFIGHIKPLSTQSNAGASIVGGKSALIVGSSPTTQVFSVDSSGTILWQRQLANPTSAGTGGVVADSTGGLTFSAAGQLIQLNSSGNIAYQRQIQNAGNAVERSSLTGRNGDFAFAVRVNGGSWSSGYVSNVRYSSTLAAQFVNTFAHNRNASVAGTGLDSSNNLYTICQTAPTSYAYYGFQINKFNSSGTIQWTRMIENSGTAVGVGVRGSACVDASGNTYVSLVNGNPYAGTSGGVAGVMKYDTNGTLVWQKYLSGYGYLGEPKVAVDSSSNTYIIFNRGAISEAIVIFKLDSSGNLVWQRLLTSSPSNKIIVREVMEDGNGAIVISGTNDSTGYSAFFKLPSDGSKTGTYTVDGFTYTYAAASGTLGNFGYGQVNGYGTAAAFTASEAATSLSVTTPAATMTKVVI